MSPVPGGRPPATPYIHDHDEFEALVGPYQHELLVHCYRILGSLQDAEEALQETLLSAWQGLASFEGRSSVRTWLYRIATNRCLDQLRAATRRPLVSTPLRFEPPTPTGQTEVEWLQPYPDDLLDPAPSPEQQVLLREATSLAFVRALQLLPARQRAVLLLRDVLDFRSSEVAAMLDVTEESVTSALKRARATLAVEQTPEPAPTPRSAAERRVVDAWLEAFSTLDVPRLLDLLTDDAWLRMPPMPFEYHGREAAGRFFRAFDATGRVQRFLPSRANGQPAYAAYQRDEVTGVWHCRGLFVLTLAGERVHEVIRFETTLLASFGLPRTLPPEEV